MPSLFPLPPSSPFTAPESAPPMAAPPMFATPTAPATPPMAAPAVQQMPSFAPMPQAPQPQRPSFLQAIMPVAAAFLAGGKDPAAMGQGLASFMRGRQLKQQQNEHEFDRQQRQQLEQAEFYGRMIEQAGQIDDPIIFERWKQAIAPVAAVHGLSTEGLTFNDTKQKAKAVASVQAAVNAAVQRHGPEILNRDDVSITTADGQQVSMSVARGLIGGEVRENGSRVPVKVPPVKDPNAPPDLARSGLDVQLLDAKRRVARGEPGAAEDLKLIEEAILKGDTLRRDPQHITVNTGANNARVDARVDRVAGSFNSHPIVKEYNEVQAQHATIRQIVSQAWSGPGDMSIIFAFMKALDPSSVVRETEFDNAAKSGNIFTGWAARFNGKLNPSGGFLSEQVKKDFLASISSRLTVKKSQYDNLRKQLVDRVDRIKSGAPETGDEALIDYASAIPEEKTGGDVSTALQKLEARRKAKGGK